MLLVNSSFGFKKSVETRDPREIAKENLKSLSSRLAADYYSSAFSCQLGYDVMREISRCDFFTHYYYIYT